MGSTPSHAEDVWVLARKCHVSSASNGVSLPSLFKGIRGPGDHSLPLSSPARLPVHQPDRSVKLVSSVPTQGSHSHVLPLPADVLVLLPRPFPQLCHRVDIILTPSSPRLWWAAPVERNFDGVSGLSLYHPGTAQGVLVEARPAWREDGPAGRSQVTTTGSWGDRGRKADLLRDK